MAATDQRQRGPIRHWVNIALTLAGVGLLGLGVAAIVSGRFQVRPVLSGSMEPGFPVGGIVVTERVPISELQIRDVVVLHRPDRPDELIVHRIVALTPSANGPVVQTQGDANTIPDPWKVTLRGATAYRAVYTLPLIGYAAVWIHGQVGHTALLIIGLLLVGFAVTGSLRHRSRHAGGTAPSADQPVEGSPTAANTVWPVTRGPAP